MDGVELAAGIERQRMRRNHRAVGDQPPHVGFHFAVVHGANPYPYSGPATANGRFVSCARCAAKAHALKRPLDGPARAGQAVEKFGLGVDGIDQQRPGFGPGDLADHGQGWLGSSGKQRADMPRLAAIADERHRIAMRPGAGRRASAEFRQQRAAVEAHRAGYRGRSIHRDRQPMSVAALRLLAALTVPDATAATAASA